MAPTQPTHRTAKPAKSILKAPSRPPSTSTSQSRTDSLFPASKKDKRRIKHAQLLSKVSKPTTASKPRRRRPSKKLVATLDSLADALPDDEADGEQADGVNQQVNVIRRKTIKSRPGALKRRQRLDNSERERFVKNLAQMAGSAPDESGGRVSGRAEGKGNGAASANQKWTALRGFISHTLERRTDVDVAT